MQPQSPSHVFAPPPVPAVPVMGSPGLFPVRRIYCIGRNFAAHAIEMGHDPDREPPFFFQKNPDSVLLPGRDLPYPPGTESLHHEVELVVALGAGGRDIPQAGALERVFGYAVGLDMTRRDLQAEAKKAARPWEIGKSFEHSAPVGEIVPAAVSGHPVRGGIRALVNGSQRQEGDLAQMIWKVPEIIAHLSRYFELAAGDLIFAGTPAGVGDVRRGDRIRAEVDGLPALEVTVV